MLYLKINSNYEISKILFTQQLKENTHTHNNKKYIFAQYLIQFSLLSQRVLETFHRNTFTYIMNVRVSFNY